MGDGVAINVVPTRVHNAPVVHHRGKPFVGVVARKCPQLASVGFDAMQGIHMPPFSELTHKATGIPFAPG